MKQLFLLILLLAPSLGVAQNASVLLQADRDFAQDVARKGVDGWMSFMAENAVVLRRQPYVGKTAIRAAMEKAFSDSSVTLSWKPTRGQVFKSGDLGYTVGRFQVVHHTNKGETTTSTGTYLTVWQKQADGAWKVIWDGGSPDPAPAAKHRASVAKKPTIAKPKS